MQIYAKQINKNVHTQTLNLTQIEREEKIEDNNDEEDKSESKTWGGRALNNNNSGTGAYKIVTFIIDAMEENKQAKNIRYADTEIAINIAVTKDVSALYHLSMKILHR